MNPRYTAYATYHGLTPTEMLERDKEKYPGGCMCGFIVWMSEQKERFFKERPECFTGRWVSDQEEWTKFLVGAKPLRKE